VRQSRRSYYSRVTVEKRRLSRSSDNRRQRTPPNSDHAIQFREWLTESDPGEEFVYHTGFLLDDRREVYERGAAVGALADLVLTALGNGKVYLTQRRLNALECDYLAVRMPNKRLAREVAQNGLRGLR